MSDEKHTPALSAEGEHLFVDALHGLGIPDEVLSSRPWDLLAVAEPDALKMGDVYKILNDDLLTLTADGPINIDHVTGEARVLVDPHHRNVIAASSSKGGVVRIACRESDFEPIRDAVTFFGAQLRAADARRSRWGNVAWPDVIDIAGLARRGSLRIFVLREPAEVHFSTFGSDRVLLQQRHPHPSEKKWVWYFRSRELVDLLQEQAEARFETGRLIPPTSFGALLQWMASAGVRSIVDGDGVPAEARDLLRSIDVERLMRAGFVRRDEAGLRSALTRDFHRERPVEKSK